MESKTKKEREGRYSQRRHALQRKIKNEVAIFSAAPEQLLSRDQSAPFRQNSDFYYLTGLTEPGAVLVLLGTKRGPRSVLFIKERNPEIEIWVGETLGIKRAKRRLDIDEILDSKTLASELPQLVQGAEQIHYAPGSHPEVDELVWSLLKNPIAPSYYRPARLADARLITSEMRIKKDRLEVQTLRHVCGITARSFELLFQDIARLQSERHAAATLESYFCRFGADGPAFSTIIASGKHATTLHHHPSFQPLWRRELVLIDAGASYRGYAADITRTIPVQGTFTPTQAKVYDIVHQALSDGIESSKPGSTLDEIHSVAVRALTKGLVALGVLDGSVQQLIAQEAYKPFYMHQTSHWLGLDVHDISPIYLDEFKVPPRLRSLEPGNVFTIEPGLYFRADDPRVPEELRGIGIRLEEDVLITKNGCEVLTAQLPVDRQSIEQMLK